MDQKQRKKKKTTKEEKQEEKEVRAGRAWACGEDEDDDEDEEAEEEEAALKHSQGSRNQGLSVCQRNSRDIQNCSRVSTNSRESSPVQLFASLMPNFR